MSRSRFCLSMLLGAALLAGCASIRVDQPTSQPFDTSDARTWRYWHSESTDQQPLSLDDQRVRRALEAGLAQRGLTQAVEAADLILRYRFEDEVRLQGSGVSYGFGFGRGPFGLGAMSDTDARAYKEHKLVLEALDTTGTRVLWSAGAEKLLTASHSPAQREKLISELVNAMLDALLNTTRTK